jgi:hypothetical protein
MSISQAHGAQNVTPYDACGVAPAGALEWPLGPIAIQLMASGPTGTWR